MLPAIPVFPSHTLTPLSSLPAGAFGTITVHLYTPPNSTHCPHHPIAPSTPLLICTKTIPLNPTAPRSAPPSLSSSLFRETLSLSLLSHPHILPLLTITPSPSGLNLHTPYYPGTLDDLFPALRNATRRDTLDTFEAVTTQIGKALEHAHAVSIAHRDIKPSNILLSPTPTGYTFILADWGLSRVLPPTPNSLTLAISTRPYRPPESLLSLPHTTAADVYSLGITAMQTLSQGFLGVGSGYGGDIMMAWSVLQCVGSSGLTSGGDCDKLSFPDAPHVIDSGFLVQGLAFGEEGRWVRRMVGGMCRGKGGERLTARRVVEEFEGWGRRGGGRGGGGRGVSADLPVFTPGGAYEENVRRGKKVVEARRRRVAGTIGKVEWRVNFEERRERVRSL